MPFHPIGSAARWQHAQASLLLILFLCGLAMTGCSSGGGSGVYFPRTESLLSCAEDIAMSADRCPPPRELQKQPLEAFYVQPGDVLLLETLDLESEVVLPADQTVMVDGTIDLGKYGRPVVAGMTVEQIEAIVLSSVRAGEPGEEIDPINVRITLAESAVYYVLGEVNSPGYYRLTGRETVLDGILTAGGLSDAASDCEIILARPTPPCNCRVVLPVCYNRIVQLGDTTTNYQLRPGDRIYVATRGLCEQLRFWSERCKFCPDCTDRGCRSPLLPNFPPFTRVAPAAPIQMPPSVVPSDEPLPLPPLDGEG